MPHFNEWRNGVQMIDTSHKDIPDAAEIKYWNKSLYIPADSVPALMDLCVERMRQHNQKSFAEQERERIEQETLERNARDCFPNLIDGDVAALRAVNFQDDSEVQVGMQLFDTDNMVSLQDFGVIIPKESKHNILIDGKLKPLKVKTPKRFIMTPLGKLVAIEASKALPLEPDPATDPE